MKIILQILFLLVTITACNNKRIASDPDRKLTVAVAANAQFAMEALEKMFEKTSDAEVELIVGSSGKLTTQMLQGAPFDVFVSADLNYPDTLYRAGMATSPPVTYALGTLVLWTCTGIDLTPGIRTIMGENVKKIAIANPKTAPYGEEALRVISNFQLYNENIASKIVYGESIAQVNQYVTSGNCEVGFTAKSVVVAPEMQGKGKWIELNPLGYQPIAQGVVITKYGSEKHPKSSKAFTDLLLSKQGQALLAEYGYRAPEAPSQPFE
jgi:molybdate transport system substrate-binding protein